MLHALSIGEHETSLLQSRLAQTQSGRKRYMNIAPMNMFSVLQVGNLSLLSTFVDRDGRDSEMLANRTHHVISSTMITALDPDYRISVMVRYTPYMGQVEHFRGIS